MNKEQTQASEVVKRHRHGKASPPPMTTRSVSFKVAWRQQVGAKASVA